SAKRSGVTGWVSHVIQPFHHAAPTRTITRADAPAESSSPRRRSHWRCAALRPGPYPLRSDPGFAHRDGGDVLGILGERIAVEDGEVRELPGCEPALDIFLARGVGSVGGVEGERFAGGDALRGAERLTV